jgi:hypothetical protein
VDSVSIFLNGAAVHLLKISLCLIGHALQTVMPQIASSAAVSADPRRSLRRNAFYPSEIDGALLL